MSELWQISYYTSIQCNYTEPQWEGVVTRQGLLLPDLTAVYTNIPSSDGSLRHDLTIFFS